jgi:uncharacterized protein
MKCPACSSELSGVSAGAIQLEVCSHSCGGVWFDAGELEKLDEREECAGKDVLRPMRNQNVVVDRTKPRQCPKCESTTLTKQMHDSQYQIEIDSCPKCSGIWLDLGELEALRSHNSDHNSRQKVIDQYATRAATGSLVPAKVKAVLRLLF